MAEVNEKLDQETTAREFSVRRKTAMVSIIVILALAIIGTLAWFINTQKSEIQGNNIAVGADSSLEMSLDGVTYKNQLNLGTDTASLPLNNLADVNFIDMTGDGLTLRRPVLVEENAIASPDSSKSWREMVSSGSLVNGSTNGSEYISFDIYFRVKGSASQSSDNYRVYLTDASSVLPANAEGELSWTDDNANHTDSNPSDYGTFSRDAIIGAARVAASDDSGLKFVWIPRPDVYLNTSGEKGKWTVTENVAATSDQYGSTHSYFQSDKTETSLSADKTIVANTDLPGDGATDIGTSSSYKGAVTSLAYNSATGYFEGKATITVWAEGDDREARRATAGGQFNVLLKLAAFNIG